MIHMEEYWKAKKDCKQAGFPYAPDIIEQIKKIRGVSSQFYDLLWDLKRYLGVRKVEAAFVQYTMEASGELRNRVALDLIPGFGTLYGAKGGVKVDIEFFCISDNMEFELTFYTDDKRKCQVGAFVLSWVVDDKLVLVLEVGGENRYLVFGEVYED